VPPPSSAGFGVREHVAVVSPKGPRVSYLSDSYGEEDFETKIVGGEPVDYPRQLQFQVSLQSAGGSHFCGGSLVAPDWVLTAAHCTQGSVGRVVVGMDRRSTDDSDDCVQARTVVRKINHPNYDDSTLENDIALLQLSSPVDYTPVAVGLSPALETAGTPLTVSGWGTTWQGGELSDELMRVDVPVVSNQQCQASYGPAGANIADTMLCAGYAQGGMDSCQGDSGGPMFGSAGGEQQLVGVVSWGFGCAQAGYPGVYTRVSAHREWICDTASVGSAFGTTPSPAPSPAASPSPSPSPLPSPPLWRWRWRCSAWSMPCRTRYSMRWCSTTWSSAATRTRRSRSSGKRRLTPIPRALARRRAS